VADKRKVRTTMQPDREIEVGEAEYTDLKRQGLLIETDETGQPVNTPAEPEEERTPPGQDNPETPGQRTERRRATGQERG
jgi:hypothetical protein